MIRLRYTRFVATAGLLVVSACASAPDSADLTATPSTAPSDSSSTAAVHDVMEIEYFEPLAAGTYSIDPDVDPSTPLRVLFQIPAQGWSRWIGGTKFAGDGHVAVSITTVTNLVRHGCSDHAWADPPVGQSVDDLAAALADLAPFRLTSPPEDVSIYGYHGAYLELTVPDLPVEGEGDDRSFPGCVDGDLKSWVAAIDTEPGDAFYGYTGPGYAEEFWILDVEGTRLVIAAEQSPDSPSEDIEEMRTILDSIRIET